MYYITFLKIKKKLELYKLPENRKKIKLFCLNDALNRFH